MNYIIVGIGEVLWDMFPTGKEMGGAPANFAYHVSQFGLDSCAVSAIGDDELGIEIICNLKNKSFKTQLQLIEYPTGTVFVDIDDRGIPRYEITENTAWDHIQFTPQLEELARMAKVVCFGSLAQRNSVSRETINRFLDVMPNGKGQYKIFDINLRQHYYNKTIICNSLNKSNILKVNDDEIDILKDMLYSKGISIEDCCKQIIEDYELEILILTCGADGSYVYTKDKYSFIETPLVDVVDTVGAGDSFTASFIASIISGSTISIAHKFAVDVSAYVCTQKGAMPKLSPFIK